MSEAVTRRCDNRIRIRNKYQTCNKELNGEPTVFSLNGEAWSGDLCDECELKLQEALAPFIQISTPEFKKVEGVVRKVLARLPDGQAVTTQDVREWAVDNGYEVSWTGRIKDSIYSAYREAKGI